MPRLLLALLLLMVPFRCASAADGAQSRAIGYSTDGKYFAFEQYGTQDGSGFPYWDVFILDLANNGWVDGTPIRVLLESEDAKLSEARDKAHAVAKPMVERLSIREPSDLLLANPFTETVADRATVRFDAYYNSMGGALLPEDRGNYELSVKKISLPQPAGCSDPDFPAFGLELTLRNLKSGTAVTVAKDISIPASRFCPLYYDIEAIHAPSSYGSSARNVAIIGVYRRGFEGDDRRFIAIPFDLID